jgi:hypothetical protein
MVLGCSLFRVALEGVTLFWILFLMFWDACRDLPCSLASQLEHFVDAGLVTCITDSMSARPLITNLTL